MVAGENDTITPLDGQYRTVETLPRRAARRHPEGRPPHPLRDAGRRRGRDHRVPRRARVKAAPVKIIVDCRYTRLERHDGISRYTARIVDGAVASAHAVTMLISDERQLAMLPQLPWVLGTAPTSAREPWIAPPAQRLRAGCRVQPHADDGHRGPQLRGRAHAPRPDLLPQPHASARPGLAHPAALAAVPPRLVAAAAAAQPGRRGRHGLRDDEDADAASTGSPTGRSRSSPTPPTSRPADHPPRELPATRDLLYMGSFMPYKNVETLARAMNALPGYRLHLLSRISDDDRARLAALAPAESIVFHDGVSDEEYARAARDRDRPAAPCRSTRASVCRSSRRWRSARRSC